MLSEAIKDELEVLRAIFVNDFQDRPPIWNQPAFSVKVNAVVSTGGAPIHHASGKFSLNCLNIKHGDLHCLCGIIYSLFQSREKLSSRSSQSRHRRYSRFI